MAPRTVYANLADGLQNVSLWDQSLADMGSLGIIPCTAGGTNSIVLTPIAGVFPPNVTTPQTLQAFSFVASANSTGPVTIQIGTTAALKLYRMDGATQATTGDLTATVSFVVNYNAALNGAAGGFQILAPISNEINPVISGATISGSTITTSTYNGNTWTAGTGILTIAALKTLTASNTLTLAGTDGTTMTFPTTSATLARTDAANTFIGHQTIESVTSTGATGTGNIVYSISPSFTTPTLGAATATTLNGNTFTTGTYTLTGTAAKTLTFNNTLTFAGTDTKTITHNASTTFGGVDGKAVAFNNSLTFAGTDAATITFQGTDTYIGRATTDTLTNKTFNSTATGNVLQVSSVTVSAGQYPGEPSNATATAGNVGEYNEVAIASNATSLTSATPTNLANVNLGQGEWEVRMLFNFTGTTTSVTGLRGSLSLTSATEDTNPGRFVGQSYNSTNPFAAFNVGFGWVVRRVNVVSAGSTFVYAVARADYSLNNCFGYGLFSYRRIR